MTDTTFTFRIDEELKNAFSNAAKAHDQSVAQLLRGFMRDYVEREQSEAEHDVWFRQQVQIGLDSANAGNLISGEDVEAEFSDRRAQALRRMGGKIG
ncbi:hypothetical protein DTW90_06625 [Neorhizobium sp. P12A]|uniref:CopG family ribbon-helix-helix protein n=1 Tax=Neorhizobium sp. P12A TaxID=2268027 RepID=UPI0011EF7F59|nr:hypothetical protein [Neorhizobium sp. P12A]KAA0699114.1 hypothetical protein DTW90_06625 [Neorhizobium sp. P12A]